MVASVYSSDTAERLASIHAFAFGGVGVAGTTSEGELAFREILSRPDAEKDFLNLLVSGNAQGKCYALAGLHYLDPKEYETQAKRFKNDKTPVTTIAGCMILAQEMSSVVAHIDAGKYDVYIKEK
jgi:hypothetical protein